MIKAIHHVQIAVSRQMEQDTISFYKNVMQFREIPKPENLRKNGGAWFELGLQQFHIAPEDAPTEYNSKSKRHVCFLVEDLEAVKLHLQKNKVEIIEDNQPIEELKRFYFRDPAGNRVECAELK